MAIEVDRLLQANSGYQLRMEAVFVARIVGGALRLDAHEVLEARFFSPDALPEGLVAAHREVIRLALDEGS